MNIDEINRLELGSFDEIRDVLPATAMEFVRIIGIEATLALISCFGGTDIRFVKSETSWKFERISQVIGRHAAMKIAEVFSSQECVYIPRCNKARLIIRDRKIIREFDEMTRKGISCREAANELAIEYRISNRQVEKIVNASA